MDQSQIPHALLHRAWTSQAIVILTRKEFWVGGGGGGDVSAEHRVKSLPDFFILQEFHRALDTLV